MEKEVKKKSPARRKTSSTEVKSGSRVPEGKTEKISGQAGRYTYAVGRRKESVAQVRLFAGTGTMTINERKYQDYFPRFDLQESLRAPLRAVGKLETVDVWARVRGGGIRGQAEAVRLGISRALVSEEPTFRASLKPLDFLRRDPRKKERKKYGLKKARRAPQWAKR